MPQGQSLCQSIYQYLAAQIKLGYYKKGTRLLTIHELCKRFRVSIGTAHKALLQLRDDGYITLSKGTPAIVTWDYQEVSKRSYDPHFYAARKDAMLALNQTLHFLFPSAWLLGSQLLKEPEQKELAQLKARGELFSYFYFLLKPLGNPLFLRLFYDIDDFLQYLYVRKLQTERFAHTVMRYSDDLAACLPLWEKQAFSALQLRLEALYQASQRSLENWFETSIPPAAQEQIPFQWQAYRGHLQENYTLATELVHSILNGSYPSEQFLPSATALAEEYNASVSTVRHTIAILNRLGITKTRNGRGSYVAVWKESTVSTALRSPDLRKKLLLYLYCLQILALSTATVARAALPQASAAALAAAEASLSKDLRNDVLLSTPGACLRLITEATSNATIRTIYRQLLDTLLWGCLLYFQPSHITPIPDWAGTASTLSESLRRRDADTFAFALQKLLTDIFHLSQQALLSIGIAEASKPADPFASLAENEPEK